MYMVVVTVGDFDDLDEVFGTPEFDLEDIVVMYYMAWCMCFGLGYQMMGMCMSLVMD